MWPSKVGMTPDCDNVVREGGVSTSLADTVGQ